MKSSRRFRPALEAFEARLLLTGGFTYTVDALTDTGAGTGLVGDLRYAITNANLNPGSTINITATGTDTLGSSLPDLTANVTIAEEAPGQFILSGGGTGSNYRALKVASGTTATLTGLAFTNFATSSDGGILDVLGTLTLDDSSLTNSTSGSLGGAAYIGISGVLTANRTTFQGNSADSSGGAICCDNALYVNGGAFRDNSADGHGGAVYVNGLMVANGVEFSGNSATNTGGAITADSGGGPSGLTVVNCTIASNTADGAGGGINTYYDCTLVNVTIANNSSGIGSSGAGLANSSVSHSPLLKNTIVAQNLAGSVESDIGGGGSLASVSSYNLVGNSSLGGITDGTRGNQVGTSGSPLDAHLGTLGENGGPNQTMAPGAGSPAIGAGLVANAVDPVSSAALAYDQRGVGYPRTDHDSIDIGAFQTHLPASTLTVSEASGTYGGTTTLTAHLTSGGSDVKGELVGFYFGETQVGSATTNDAGLATILNVSLAGINAGTYTGDVTASFAGDENYAGTDGSGDLTVTPAALTITASDRSKVYGAALPTLTASYTGFVNGDTAASLDILPTLSTTATSASHVGGSPYAITAAGAADTNYTISYVPGSLTVTAAPLTIAADGQVKVYGAALPTLTASYTGFVNGDTASSLGTRPTLTTTATSASHVGGGPYAITAAGAADTDYAISYVGGSLTVTPAPLLIVPVPGSKVYGAASPTLTASYLGFVNGDTSASLATRPTLTSAATATSPVAGGPYATFASGAVDPDYTISYMDGSLLVTRAMLTVTADDQVKVYGAALPTLTASYSGFVNGETASSLDILPTLTTTATSASHVGGSPYAITAGGADAANYSIQYVAGNLTVTRAALTIAADSQGKAYGGPLPSLTATYSGFVNGDTLSSLDTPATLSTTATASSHVAGNPYAITAGGAASGDYAISYVAGGLTVVPVALTIAADGQVKVYGAALPTLTASYTGFVNGDTASSLGTRPTLTTTATSASHVGGGPYAITAGGAADPDYAISYVPGSLTVTAAPLTITADNKTKLYLAALPTLTASYSGLVNGDTAASLSARPTLTTTATASGTVAGNPYAISASGAVDPDYAISYAPGVLTVTSQTLTIKADDRTMVYGSAVPALTLSYSGFVDGDTPASLTTLPTATTVATSTSDVAGGPYAILVGGAFDPNYVIVYIPGKLTITPAPLTLAIDGKSRAYGRDNPALTGVISGVLNGDDVAASYASTAIPLSDVVAGGYSITLAGLSGSKAGNYFVASASPGTLTVTPAPLTVTVGDQSRIYGRANPGFTASYGGFVLGQDAGVLAGVLGFETSADGSSHVGRYAVRPVGLSSLDYAIEEVAGTLSVTPAPLNVTPVNFLKTYGMAVPTLTAAYSGFVDGDTPASLASPVLLSTPVTSATHFGVYPIIATGAASGDYDITYTDGAVAVIAAPLYVTPDNMLISYGLAVPSLSATFAGFVNGDTPAGLGVPVGLGTPAAQGSDPGLYPIYSYGGASADYTIIHNQGALAIAANPGGVAFLTSLYRDVLGRAPGTYGLVFWLSALADGHSESDVADQIYNSAEAKDARAGRRVSTTLKQNAAYRLALAAQAQALAV